MNNNKYTDTEGAAITALASITKTPFKTAFMATLGLGTARFLMFAGFVTFITLLIKVLF